MLGLWKTFDTIRVLEDDMQRHATIFSAALGGGLLGFLLGGAMKSDSRIGSVSENDLVEAILPAARLTSAPSAPASLDLTLTHVADQRPIWAMKPTRFME